MRISWTLVATILAVISSGLAMAGDSPQFRGPNRDGKFDEKGLLQAWPENGPAVLWVAKGLGKGYASLSVVNGKIYVPGMMDDQSANLFVLNTNGAIEQTIPYGKETVDKQAPGPRSTPTIDGDRAYILSGLGALCCIDLAKGEKIWEVNLLERFKGQMPQWTFAESVLVDGERVICTPGGPDAGVAALNKMTGETVWTTKGLSDTASYCAPIIVNHKGRRILLTETAKLVVGIDADSGALLWTHDHVTDYDIHGVTPIYDNGLVYFSGGYGSGGGCLELSPDGASVTVKWTDKNLDCQHHGVVLVDGFLYGTGHKKGELMCLEMATGKVMWSTNEVTQGNVIYSDGMLYVYEGPKAGIVSIVKAVPTGFERAGKVSIVEGTDKHWAHPVIANGILFVRHGDSLIAYDIVQK